MRERDTSVRVFIFVAFLLPISALWAGTASTGDEFFETRVRPLLSEKCFKCHSQEARQAGKLKAGLLLDSRSGILRGGDSGVALIPGSPSESLLIESFVTDSSEYAFGKVVDQLLESVQHGERWARHWLDIARYSDGYGGFGDGAPLPKAWQYRDWVVQALNADLPYDEFVRRQIAGDPLKRQNRDAVGTGFFVVGPTYRSDGGTRRLRLRRRPKRSRIGSTPSRARSWR